MNSEWKRCVRSQPIFSYVSFFSCKKKTILRNSEMKRKDQQGMKQGCLHMLKSRNAWIGSTRGVVQKWRDRDRSVSIRKKEEEIVQIKSVSGDFLSCRANQWREHKKEQTVKMRRNLDLDDQKVKDRWKTEGWKMNASIDWLAERAPHCDQPVRLRGEDGQKGRGPAPPPSPEPAKEQLTLRLRWSYVLITLTKWRYSSSRYCNSG